MEETDNALILLIDDCQFTLQSIDILLKEYGYDVLSFTDAGEAIGLILR